MGESAEALAGFRRAVLQDPLLQRDLLAVPDRRDFVAVVVARAVAGGWDVGPGDVEEALRAARRRWRDRWL
ncbi:MAG TPA: hypothetical protein VG795_15590 [Acidimicrobiia bacterium]|nr:hypothetical protein [Acidimicrobiia bacterium]